MIRCTLLALLCLAAASAQVSAQSDGDTPDVVRLRDGGFLRGRIIEYLPDDHLRIRLATGEERRIDASRVAWAGPEAEQPFDATMTPPVAPAPTLVAPSSGVGVARPIVPVRFEADRDGVAVQLRVGTQTEISVGGGYTTGVHTSVIDHPVWEHVCVAPCTAQLLAGRFYLGVSLEEHGVDAHTRQIEEYVDARGPTTVQIHWGDRQDYRIAGALTWTGGGLLGGILGGVGLDECLSGICNEAALGLTFTGLAIFTTATIVGLALMLLEDEVRLSFQPTR